MVKVFGLSAFACALFALGLFCLCFHQKVQPIAVKALGLGLPTRVEAVNDHMRLVTKFVKSDQYLVCLRLIGMVTLLFAVLVVWVLREYFRGHQ